uniref:HID1 domain-containing protein n=1 Tax=Strigamia maritima TaxID=126957 RepID=T1IJN7_STRMM
MGNSDTKLNFRKAVIQLTTKAQPVDAADETFWDQFWCESIQNVQDVFTLIPAVEIRALREESPSNLATLCYKAVEKLVRAADGSCSTHQEQLVVLNCVRLLTRILPYIFEDPDWRGFFWSSLPNTHKEGAEDVEMESPPLAQSLINSICDLLFCPDFSVSPNKKNGPDNHEDLQSIDSCEYIWEAGVGFAHSPPHIPYHFLNRTELLKLLLTCFSPTVYQYPNGENMTLENRWIEFFTSAENRHALPTFTSLLNCVCAYDPIGYGVPYNHLLFTDSMEQLVEVALQILIVCLDHNVSRDGSDEIDKFLFYVLKSSDVLDILVPILFHLNDSRADQSRVGLMHIGVFILLLLSGERNFGVRLNKPYTSSVPLDIPVFTGTHADLLAFSTPWFLFSNPTNHHLIFFLLEIFNNIIQYQFDGNSNLVYTIIRKRNVFHQLANLPTDNGTIHKSMSKNSKKQLIRSNSAENKDIPSMEGSKPALPAEPGTLNASLQPTPGIEKMTEKEQAHPDSLSLQELASLGEAETLDGNSDDSAQESDVQPSRLKQNDVVREKFATLQRSSSSSSGHQNQWVPSTHWVQSWKQKLPLQTIMRLLQVLVPQVEKICIDKGLTDESEILKFLQHGTLVGLLPVPHPILIRKYQANSGTTLWFHTYMWGVIYLRNMDPPIWYDTDVKLFEIQRV